MLWGAEHRQPGLAVLGDNIAALSGIANLRGKGPLTLITKEIAWRRLRYHWRYCVGHLPSEGNVLADALSRLEAPLEAECKSFPPELKGCTRRQVPVISSVWQC